MNKAKILIPKYDHYKHEQYMEAINFVGGEPVLTSITEYQESNPLISGILIPGGIDIDPSMYNENKSQYCHGTDINRDKLEAYFINQAFSNNIPILGICRGMQLMAILTGGSLYQDISLNHSAKSSNHYVEHFGTSHEIYVTDYELFNKIFGDKITPEPKYFREILQTDRYKSNSTHHQCLKFTGQRFQEVAIAQDSVTEAIYSYNNNFEIGVQYHPEDLDYREDILLFRAFVEAAEHKEYERD